MALFGTMIAAFALAVDLCIRSRERAQKHIEIVEKLGSVVLMIDKLFQELPHSLRVRDSRVTEICAEYDQVLQISPTLPWWIDTYWCCCGAQIKDREITMPLKVTLAGDDEA